MKESRSGGGLVWKFASLIFTTLPLALAGKVLGIIYASENRQIKRLIASQCVILSLVLFVSSWWILPFTWNFLRAGNASPSVKFIIVSGIYFGLYLGVFFPAFLLWAHWNEESRKRLFERKDRRKEPDPEVMREARFRSNAARSYIGQSFHTGRAVYLTNEQRLMHTEVVGSTGTGKTESVLLTLLAHDIAAGKGAIVIDGKGDLELLDRIYYIIRKKARPDKFLFFSLSHPEKSNTYNPLYWGNATELKDKIIGSTLWGEEFYRKMAEKASLTLLKALVLKNEAKDDDKREAIRFSELYEHLTNLDSLERLSDSVIGRAELHDDMVVMVNQFRENQKFLSGLMADLFLNAKSEFSSLLEVSKPEIDLYDVYLNNKIVYFQLDLQGYQDTAKRLGRMILQDIRSVSSRIQTRTREHQRHFFPVFIDDASSFLDTNFVDLLNKIRASRMAITLLHQSPGDLVFHRDFSFQQQIIENTNIKIILRQDDPQSVEKLTKIGGTRRTLIPTYQTEEKPLGKGLTGVGSIREGQTFRVEPDLIRGLQRGEAVLIWKNPTFHTDYLKLDYFNHPGVVYPLENKARKAPENKKEEKKSPNERQGGKEKKEEKTAGNPEHKVEPEQKITKAPEFEGAFVILDDVEKNPHE
ncbi:MAG: type IV secretory system conjugative DNA transfer family protein [Nitrospirae bacterium]|nr:type IV secretory system conjugative DNA transfer family protein [Nitrospirota bacterium]